MNDRKYAFRQLATHPGFTAVAVLTLALGIGANTAIYSVIDGVLLRATPFEDAHRLAVVWQTDRNSSTTREPASVPDFVDFEERATTFANLAAFSGDEVNLIPDTAIRVIRRCSRWCVPLTISCPWSGSRRSRAAGSPRKRMRLARPRWR